MAHTILMFIAQVGYILAYVEMFHIFQVMIESMRQVEAAAAGESGYS